MLWQLIGLIILLIWAAIIVYVMIKSAITIFSKKKEITPSDVDRLLWEQLMDGMPIMPYYYRLSVGEIVGERLDLGGDLAAITKVSTGLFGVRSYAPFDFDRWSAPSFGGAGKYFWRTYWTDCGDEKIIFVTVVDRNNNMLNALDWPIEIRSLLDK